MAAVIQLVLISLLFCRQKNRKTEKFGTIYAILTNKNPFTLFLVYYTVRKSRGSDKITRAAALVHPTL
jgi:uncharacterized membrane protein YozB (DUF420 family)